MAVFVSTTGDENIIGTTGNDEFRWNKTGTNGSDTLDGLAGIDLLDLTTGGLSEVYKDINLAAGTVRVRDDRGRYLGDPSGPPADPRVSKIDISNIENVRAASEGVSIIGTSGANDLWVDAGFADVSAGAGDDTITGIGTPDDLKIKGEDGDDTILINPSSGGRAGKATAFVSGGAGMDTLILPNEAFLIEVKENGTKVLVRQGDREVELDNTVETISFGEGGTSYTFEQLRTPPPPVQGTDNGENLAGTERSEVINAGGGWDWVMPGTGSDTVNGGAGQDMVSFDNLPVPGIGRGYRLDLDLGTGVVKTSTGDTYQLNSVERVTGSIAQDRMKGSAGDDLLRGLGDYDWFRASTGKDTIDGGSGQDMISFLDWVSPTDTDNGNSLEATGAPPAGNVVDGVVVDLADALNNTNLASGQTLISIERVTGSSWQDVFYGDGNSNFFRGMGGYDWFVGSGGGRERYHGGTGIDTMTYFQSTSGVEASLRNGALSNGQETGSGSRGDAALDLYFEIENLVGTHFDDHLAGNSERNVLNGLDGDDTLFGHDGNDQLRGGRGSDRIFGGAGSDTALFDANIGDYTVTKNSQDTVKVVAGEDSDLLSNVEYFQFADTTVSIWEL